MFIDKYGDNSKLVNRLGITKDAVTEVIVLVLWCLNKLYIIILISKLD